MISLLAIANSRGDISIYQEYRNDVSFKELSTIVLHITKEKSALFAPYIRKNGISGHYIRREKLVFVAVSKRQISSIAALNFLDKFCTILKDFCGTVTEEAIEKNFVVIHEIMTECLENGYVQTMNTEQLRSVVYSDPVRTETSDNKKPGLFGVEKNSMPGSAAARPLVKSRSHQNVKRNEVFIDVVEKLSVRFERDGIIKQFHLKGEVVLKNLITCTHSLIVRLNEEIQLKAVIDAYTSSSACIDNWYFDSSVDFNDFDKNRSFVVQPAQGEVKVMHYSLHSAIPHRVPFKLSYVIQNSKTNQDCNLLLKLACQIPSNRKAINVIVHIPVSSATKSVMQQHSIEESVAKFLPNERQIKWFIKSMPGKSSVISQFKLVDAIQCPANELEMGPVSVDFEVSNYVCSGINIKSVNAVDPSKQSIPMSKWIRYVTLPDSYSFRI